MTDLLTENARLRAARWQPIETAPKGELIDIWLKEGKRWCDCYYDHICDEWRTSRPSGKLVWVKAAQVSHWMPRPSAPTALATPAPDAVQEAAIDIADIENGGKRWHGEDHRVVAVRWEPYKPDGQRQMKAKGRWQEQVGSGDYWRWQNCDRPATLRAIAGDRT